MKKLSKIDESAWGDMRKRSSGNTLRQEDIGKIIEIDGVKYTFTKDFWGMGDIYNEENSDEWTCFAFNKMPDGGTTISGDTEIAGAFGEDKWDIGEYPYDVYVLRDYFEKTKQELVQDTIDNGNINDIGISQIENILIDYVKELYEKHMSDYAYYWIYEQHNSDWSDDAVLYVWTVVDDVIDNVIDEFKDYSIKEAHQIIFPMLNHTDWDNRLEASLTFAYEKLGYKKSEEYQLDPYSSPGSTKGICFVLLGDKTEENDEEDSDY